MSIGGEMIEGILLGIDPDHVEAGVLGIQQLLVNRGGLGIAVC